jgi:tRNA/rRNA methyltransferase
MRRAALAAGCEGPPPAEAVEPDAGAPATHAQREAFLEHFEQALIAVGFLDPAVPRKLMPRMRRLFGRAQLRAEEVDLLRGVCKQMLLAARGALPGRRPPGS